MNMEAKSFNDWTEYDISRYLGVRAYNGVRKMYYRAYNKKDIGEIPTKELIEFIVSLSMSDIKKEKGLGNQSVKRIMELAQIILEQNANVKKLGRRQWIAVAMMEPKQEWREKCIGTIVSPYTSLKDSEAYFEDVMDNSDWYYYHLITIVRSPYPIDDYQDVHADFLD